METLINIRENLQHPNQILERHLMPKYTMCRSLLQIETGRYINFTVNKDFALLVIS
jgi:hypothetical protein